MKKSVLEEKGLLDAWKYVLSAKYAFLSVDVLRSRAVELMRLKNVNFLSIIHGEKEVTGDDMYIFPRAMYLRLKVERQVLRLL